VKCRWLIVIIVLTAMNSLAKAEEPKMDSAAGSLRMTITKETEALLATDREWAEAVKGEDLERVFAYWTDDAVLYSVFGSGMNVVGKDEIRRLVAQRRGQSGPPEWEPLEAFVDASGEVGATRGTYKVTVPGPDDKPVTRTGEYFNIWKKGSDGTWKCAIETHF
jgi:ketosteroid isomerase-like protein